MLIGKVLAFIVLALAATLLSTWGVLAIWYRFPGPEGVRISTAGVFALLGLVTFVAFFTR